mmetsp:Transcript_27156/g.38467  ORF Transcript_27156/g.38467 Transcript_27156/m.38467 type:complete len:155 (+) Transcript_27156:300-764(+)
MNVRSPTSRKDSQRPTDRIFKATQLCQMPNHTGIIEKQDDPRDIKFGLVEDHFGIQYNDIANAKHLISILQQHYKVSVDWKGEKYLGMALKWNYDKCICNVSMPGYTKRALTRFQHPMPLQKQYSPHKHDIPQYDVKTQYTDDPDNSPALDTAN